MAKVIEGLAGDIARALESAGFVSYRGGDKRGRSGYWIEDRGGWAKIKYVAGADEMICSDYNRRVALPEYAQALRAAGFSGVGVIVTQRAGDWVQASPQEVSR